MKKLCATLFVTAALIGAALGQGQVNFANTSTTLIWTNSASPGTSPISGVGAYRFALYIAPFGQTPNTLFAQTTNNIVPGRFSGGQPTIPAAVGTVLSFQIWGWASQAGNTLAEATAFWSQNPNVPFGSSSVGFFTVPASLDPIVILFGTGPGQVSGFGLDFIPEPSTYALAALALACWAVRRRCK